MHTESIKSQFSTPACRIPVIVMIIASSIPRATNYQRLQTQKHQQLISPQNRNLMVLIREHPEVIFMIPVYWLLIGL